MLNKRLIGVVTVINGLAVQSFGYKRYLPLGKPEIVAKNLDRWGVDEILLQCIDRSIQNLPPDFALLERVGKTGLSTPVIYAGGIRTHADGIKAIKLGADRICLDAMLRDSPNVIVELSQCLGAQALIGALPLNVEDNQLHWYDYRKKKSAPLCSAALEPIKNKLISEVLLIDWQNEGIVNGFNQQILEKFIFPEVPIIAFGGLSEASQLQRVLNRPNVIAAALGNFFNYRENSVAYFKDQLLGIPMRMSSSFLP